MGREVKRYTVIYTLSNGQAYSEVLDRDCIEFVSNEVENRFVNPYFILKNPDGISRLTTSHIANVDIFEGSDVH